MCILIIDIFILNYLAGFFKHLISFYIMAALWRPFPLPSFGTKPIQHDVVQLYEEKCWELLTSVNKEMKVCPKAKRCFFLC